MATTGLTITEEAQDIVDAMSLAAGSYLMQCIHRTPILVHDGATAPDDGDDYHFLQPYEYLTVTVGTGTKVWIRTRFGSSRIVLTEE